ncbi:MAG: hypothetical protein J6S71_02970 [Clostridia bacterium]|nr:hypothetical protein [Clostridia bacterium]
MSYGNYAPFYRPGFFNPMQNNTPIMPNMTDNMNAFGQQFQQGHVAPQMQQPSMQMPNVAAPQVNDMIWVLNETEATSYPVAPGNTVTLWDKSSPTIYIKSVDAVGVPSMRTLDFTERAANAPKTPSEHVCTCGDKFVTKEAFTALEEKLKALTAKINKITVKEIFEDGESSV